MCRIKTIQCTRIIWISLQNLAFRFPVDPLSITPRLMVNCSHRIIPKPQRTRILDSLKWMTDQSAIGILVLLKEAFEACYHFFSYFFANCLSSNLWRNAKYLSKLVPAHCWQKHSSVGTNEPRGNGPFGAFFRETKNRWRGRILWSNDKLKYIGYLVKECTSLLSSLIKYMCLGFRLFSRDRDKT